MEGARYALACGLGGFEVGSLTLKALRTHILRLFCLKTIYPTRFLGPFRALGLIF